MWILPINPSVHFLPIPLYCFCMQILLMAKLTVDSRISPLLSSAFVVHPDPTPSWKPNCGRCLKRRKCAIRDMGQLGTCWVCENQCHSQLNIYNTVLFTVHVPTSFSFFFFFFLPIAALTLTSFYGKKLEDSPADSPADSQGEDGDNLVSIIKRRRILAAKAAQEKEKRELERRLQ